MLFAEIDMEAFAGLPPIFDACAAAVERLRAARMRRIVLAGAGTSGRLAFLLARRHRAAGLDVVPWIAGGHEALLVPIEGAEDDVERARAELDALLAAEPAAFFGISCGLSAPCVAAGIEAAKAHGCPTFVFGTNCPECARPGFAATLDDRVTTLTPDVGPEALAGSSRMKCGTATWIVLDALLTALAGEAGARSVIAARIDAARRASENAAIAPRGEAIDAAARAMRAGGRVVYTGAADAGCAGILDASECPPTFGARPDQVRGYVEGGWSELLPDQDTQALEARFPLSLEHFAREVVPVLGERDLVIELTPGTAPGATRARILSLPHDDLLAAKLTLNAVSTGAFVRAGKVYGNRMVDLALSNSKLFDRACRIVSDLTGVTAAEALRSVVAALYDQDPPPTALLSLPVESHLARSRPGVVPLALLHAGGMQLDTARALLAAEPVVRDALRKAGRNVS